MPFLKKPSFRPSAKVPKRRPDAGTAQHELLDKAILDPALDFSQTPVKITLGDKSMVFSDGVWLAEDGDDGSNHGGINTRGASRMIQQLKDQVNELEEENNMLKYKVEVLLDMVALTNADLNTKESEIALLHQKLENKGRAVKR